MTASLGLLADLRQISNTRLHANNVFFSFATLTFYVDTPGRIQKMDKWIKIIKTEVLDKLNEMDDHEIDEL